MIDINHIAKLARMELTEEEKQKLEKELSAILNFVEKLKEADLENVKPMAGGTDLVNVYRDDEPAEKNEKQREKILDNAPKEKDGYVEVKAVFE